MNETVLLDSGVIGMVTHPRRNAAEKAWLSGLLRARRTVFVPEIADYEVRRELLRAGKRRGIERLDLLIALTRSLPVTSVVLRKAAEFWAEARRRGRPTADAKALDVDMILAAHAAVLTDDGHQVIIATTNVGHLALFADARLWHDIEP